MAQLGARLNGIEEVEGSNPSRSTENPVDISRVLLYNPLNCIPQGPAGVVGNLPETRNPGCKFREWCPQSALCRTRLPFITEGRTGEPQ